jgi:hypothetical protein
MLACVTKHSKFRCTDLATNLTMYPSSIFFSYMIRNETLTQFS